MNQGKARAGRLQVQPISEGFDGSQGNPARFLWAKEYHFSGADTLKQFGFPVYIPPMRIAIYGRVSTQDQELETQLRPVREWAKIQGHSFEVWGDVASAGDLRGRQNWRRLLELVRSGRPGFDAIVVWKLDRAFRSVVECHTTLAELAAYGIGFISITQPIDTTSATGKLLLSILAAFAEFERELIVERTKSGMDLARAQGKHVGRPAGAKDKNPRRRAGYFRKAYA